VVCMNRKCQPSLMNFERLWSKVDPENGCLAVRLNFGKVNVILQWYCRSRTDFFGIIIGDLMPVEDFVDKKDDNSHSIVTVLEASRVSLSAMSAHYHGQILEQGNSGSKRRSDGSACCSMAHE
jgi:hypothetical protein